MKVVHFANWAPRQSGMYESCKDQVKYERRSGLDSQFVDAHHEKPDGRKDGWFEPIAWKDAEDADVWVMHSFIPEPLKKLFGKKKTVAVLHGPTEHMTILEWATARQKTTFNLHVTLSWQYDATVCLNRHEFDIMKMYDEKNRLHYIPNSIDLERFGKDDYRWEYMHRPAIISCDVPRVEKLPCHIIWSMPKIHELIPDARLNLFGFQLEPIQTWRNLFCRAKQRNLERLCENIQLENNNLAPFMAGADIGFNNNLSGILSRVSMEMMAHGVPLVSYGGDQNGAPYTKYVARIFDLDSIAQQVHRCWKDLSAPRSRLRAETKAFARRRFDRAVYVKEYIKLYEELKNG